MRNIPWGKLAKILGWVALTVAVISAAPALFLWGIINDPGGRDEVLKTRMKGLEVVVIETNGGATTSFGYDIYVYPQSEERSEQAKVAGLYAPERARPSKANISVLSEGDQLVIKMPKCRYSHVDKDSVFVEGKKRDLKLVFTE